MSKVYMTIRTPYDDQANKTIKAFTKEEDATIWMYGMAAKYLFDWMDSDPADMETRFQAFVRKYENFCDCSNSLGKAFLRFYTEQSCGDIGIYDSEVME